MSGEEESSVVESEEDDSEWDEEEYEESDDDALDLGRGRTILWLCQEGQLKSARRRFDLLHEKGITEQDATEDAVDSTRTGEEKVRKNKFDQLRKEVFQVGTDRNYALHEILMGGTSDTNAKVLAAAILDFGKDHFPVEHQRMLTVKPPSHGRTALHWAAWGNASVDILQSLVTGNPEALVIKDSKSKGNRTPLEIYRYYYFSSRRDYIFQPDDEESNDKLQLLEKTTTSWTKHRLRLAVHCSAHLYFRVQQLTPFDKKTRKEKTSIKPKPWFIISVLGYLLQREMQPLVVHVLSFLGHNAKIHNNNAKSNRKRKRNN